MLRTRLWIFLGVCLVAASASWADDLGYIDCANHSEDTPVFAKARKSQDIVANVPCGERFKVVQYGFIFSAIQTSDGKVGFIYSNIMTIERGGGSLQARSGAATTPTLSTTGEKTKIYAPKPTPPPAQPPTATADAPPARSSPTAGSGEIRGTVTEAQPASAPAAAPQPTTLPGPDSVMKATASNATSAEAPANPSSSAVSSTDQPSPAPVTAAPPAPTPAPAATSSPTAPPATAESVPASAAPAATSPSTAEPAASAPDSNAAPATPNSAAPAQPQPSMELAQPITRNSPVKQQWEKPNPGARTASLLELYGGFAFARVTNGGYSNGTNLMGGMGSFGWNVKPWIQIVGDSSYNVTTISGVKNVLYGNHFGGRFFLRGRSKWSITPFGEALVGGSRADVHYPATPGYAAYTTSQNCISYKIGGGLDIHPSRMFEVRLIDADYYRTAFGTNVHQTNYWFTSGIVIRLFKGWGNE